MELSIVYRKIQEVELTFFPLVILYPIMMIFQPSPSQNNGSRCGRSHRRLFFISGCFLEKGSPSLPPLSDWRGGELMGRPGACRHERGDRTSPSPPHQPSLPASLACKYLRPGQDCEGDFLMTSNKSGGKKNIYNRCRVTRPWTKTRIS